MAASYSDHEVLRECWEEIARIVIPDKSPEIEFPPDSDPKMIENWKKDDALGVNCFSVVGQLDIKGQKPLKKQVDIKIRYYNF